MTGNPKIITKFIALLIFAIVLVVCDNAVELLNESNVIVEDKVLTDSNEIKSNKEVTEITAKALVNSSIEELEIKAEVLVEEEEEVVVVPVIVYDGLTMDELTNKLNRVLSSTLAGTGSSFANYSIQLGVDPYLAVAIVLQETGCYGGYCSAMVNQCYNVGGMKTSGTGCWGGEYASFTSLDEGIKAYINNLYNNYVSRGLTTAEAMNASYAEDTLWASRVNNYINIIRNS